MHVTFCFIYLFHSLRKFHIVFGNRVCHQRSDDDDDDDDEKWQQTNKNSTQVDENRTEVGGTRGGNSTGWPKRKRRVIKRGMQGWKEGPRDGERRKRKL